MKYTKAKDTNIVHALRNCDPEVSFKDHELRELTWLESKFERFYDSLQKITHDEAT